MDEHNGHIRAHVLGYWEIKQEELIKWGRGEAFQYTAFIYTGTDSRL